MKNVFWILPVAFLAWIGLKKYNLSQSYSLNFKGVNFKDLSFGNPVVNIIYTIENPTDTTANVQNIQGALFYNGIYVGNVTNFKSFVIKSGITEFTISARIDYRGLSNILLNLNKNFQLYFDGKIKIDYIDFPLKFVYER